MLNLCLGRVLSGLILRVRELVEVYWLQGSWVD